MRQRYIVVLDVDEIGRVPLTMGPAHLGYLADEIGDALDVAHPGWHADCAVYWTLEDALTDRDQGIGADHQVNGT